MDLIVKFPPFYALIYFTVLMNYEALLDEVMINTIGAQQFIPPSKQFSTYAVCPSSLEFNANIFFSWILMSIKQEQPIIFLVQVEELPEELMLYIGRNGPHFGRSRDFWSQKEQLILRFPQLEHYPQRAENSYADLDKVLAYSAVLHPQAEHLIFFCKKWAKNLTQQAQLAQDLKPLIAQNWSLVVMSDLYANLPVGECKAYSIQLLSQFKRGSLELSLQEDFPAISILSQLIGPKDQFSFEYFFNTADLGLEAQKSTSFRVMLD